MPRKTTILIYDGDDFETLARLRQEVTVAERKAAADTTRLGDDTPGYLTAARDAYDAFVDEAASRAEEWVLHAIGHEAWRELLKAHPARKVTEGDKEVTHPDDQGFEVNTETFGRALLTFVDPEDEEHRTVAEPFGSLAALQKRLRRLSAGEFESLWATAYLLNTGAVADPKAARYSPGRKSDET